MHFPLSPTKPRRTQTADTCNQTADPLNIFGFRSIWHRRSWACIGMLWAFWLWRGWCFMVGLIVVFDETAQLAVEHTFDTGRHGPIGRRNSPGGRIVSITRHIVHSWLRPILVVHRVLLQHGRRWPSRITRSLLSPLLTMTDKWIRMVQNGPGEIQLAEVFIFKVRFMKTGRDFLISFLYHSVFDFSTHRSILPGRIGTCKFIIFRNARLWLVVVSWPTNQIGL